MTAKRYEGFSGGDVLGKQAYEVDPSKIAGLIVSAWAKGLDSRRARPERGSRR